MYTTIEDLIEAFESGDKPSSGDFENLIRSLWHKSEKLSLEDIEGLSTLFFEKIDSSTFDAAVQDLQTAIAALQSGEATRAFQNQAAATAKWVELDGAGNTPTDGITAILIDEKEIHSWDGSVGAKTVWVKDFIYSIETTKTKNTYLIDKNPETVGFPDSGCVFSGEYNDGAGRRLWIKSAGGTITWFLSREDFDIFLAQTVPDLPVLYRTHVDKNPENLGTPPTGGIWKGVYKKDGTNYQNWEKTPSGVITWFPLPKKDTTLDTDFSVVRFGLVADTHCGKPTNKIGLKYFQDTLSMMNRLPLDFFIHLGDMIDKDAASKSLALQLFNKTLQFLGCQKYLALGNHDGVNDNLQGVNELYSYVDDSFYGDTDTYNHPVDKLGYYHVNVRGIDLFVLNTNQDSLADDGDWKLDDVQEAWLQSELNALAGADKRVLICSHVSFAETAASKYQRVSTVQQLRIQAMLEVWEAAHGIVLGVFNGHQHANYNYTINGIEYIAFEAQMRDVDYIGSITKMAFSHISWNETTKIFKIEGYGMQSNYEFDYSDKV